MANAVRDLRGDSEKPRSMLVNMSRFVKVQKYIKEYIDELYLNFERTVRYDFSEDSSKIQNFLYIKNCSLYGMKTILT